MGSYNVNNGDTLTIDQLPTESIDYININDGVCNIVNNTNDGYVFEFESSGFISVKAFGQLNIRGQLIEIGASDGNVGFSVQHWQADHPVNVVWVETGEGTDEYEPWFGINPNGSTALSFEDFADSNLVGRVFKWNSGTIEFSDVSGNGYIPPAGAKIKVPNIILSTVEPFTSSSTTAKINYDEGGFISIKGVTFSDFSGTLKGMSHLDTEHVSFFGSAYIQYCNDFNIVDTHGGIKDNYSTGMSFSYSSNGVVENVSGASIKSKGVTFNYLKNVEVNNVTGIVCKRDSSSDFPIFLSTVQGSKVKNVKSFGGAFKMYNANDVRIEGVTTIDSILLTENSYKATSNIDIENSSSSKVRDWVVPENGGAKIAYIKLVNSPGIDVINGDIHSSYATNVVSSDVSFGTRMSEIRYDGYTGSTPFHVPSKNNGFLLQSITSQLRPDVSIESPNAILKGIEATDIATDNPGASGSNFAQLYTSDTEGKLVFIMQKDSVDSGFFSDMIGTVKMSNNGRIYFSSIGDTAEFMTPYRIKGVTFKDEEVVINGYGTGAVALDYSIDTGDGFGQFKALNKDNLIAETIDPAIGFMMKVRAVTGTVSGTCYISSIELSTIDDRYVYPLDFEFGKIVFAENAILDEDAKYYMYYSDGYGSDAATIVKDADGIPIMGEVDGREYVDFTYDFIGDDDGGRTPGQPFNITLVVAGKSMAENVVIDQEFNEGQVNVFTARPEKEYGYIGA
jgi:hypothetical protein